MLSRPYRPGLQSQATAGDSRSPARKGAWVQIPPPAFEIRFLRPPFLKWTNQIPSTPKSRNMINYQYAYMTSSDRSRRCVSKGKPVSGTKYQCWLCKAEGKHKAFDTIQALAGHIRMAHKSSTKKRKKAKQIEKALDKIAGIFSEDFEKVILRHRGKPIAEFWVTPSIKKLIKDAYLVSRNFENQALLVAIVLSELKLAKLKWYVRSRLEKTPRKRD